MGKIENLQWKVKENSNHDKKNMNSIEYVPLNTDAEDNTMMKADVVPIVPTTHDQTSMGSEIRIDQQDVEGRWKEIVKGKAVSSVKSAEHLYSGGGKEVINEEQGKSPKLWTTSQGCNATEFNSNAMANCNNSFDILGEGKSGKVALNLGTGMGETIGGDGRKGRKTNLPKTLKSDYVLEY